MLILCRGSFGLFLGVAKVSTSRHHETVSSFKESWDVLENITAELDMNEG